MSGIGVVTIGRNEGERLVRSLKSLLAQLSEHQPIIYVDSGSSDGSCDAARKLGVEVVDLDMSIPFTAARARNAGFEFLRKKYPEVEYVQFIDGDCEVVEGWIEAAATELDAKPEVVAVCGWRCERYPERSIYNRICNVEWHMGAVGTIENFGGDVMIRAKALEAVGGYNNNVIAAEDDEVGVRLRQAKGTLIRIDRDSTLHDADMHSPLQWWQRAKRCGYAYAQVSSLHGDPPESKFIKEIRRTWLWGLILPAIALALAFPTHGLSLIIFGRYPVAALKSIYSMQKQGYSWADSVPWGISCGLSAFPEAMGALKFTLDRLSNKSYEIIEYKGAKQKVI